jgi:cysteine desulfuration protein SufE
MSEVDLPENITIKQEELIAEFSAIDDWQDRYRAIIELADELEEYPDELKLDTFLIKECQNRAWLYPYQKDGRLFFKADSEAVLVKGLLAMVLSVYSGQSAKDIADTPPSFLEKLNLGDNLTRNRKTGLLGVITRIKSYAKSFVN